MSYPEPEEIPFWSPFIMGFGSCLMLSAVCLSILTTCCDCRSIRQQLIDKNQAEYRLNATTGEVEFTLK